MNSYNDLIIIDIYKQKKDDPEIQKAFEIANVGSGKGILLSDDLIEIPNYYGLFLPVCLYQYSDWNKVFHTALYYDVDFSLRCQYYIAISGKVNRIREKYPAFFLYVFAHELGHARTFLSNPEIHIFSCLLKEFFEKASCLKINPWEYPDEKKI